jgi:4-amino-4-deoxy-L-arabinose transferase-like glycosyltransferase
MKISDSAIIKIFIIFTIITRVLLAFRPEVQLAERPYNDDAYYALTVGYHLGNGNWFSIDGVHPTNGVQPLIVVLYGAAFSLVGQDKLLGLRLTMIIPAITDCICILAIYFLLRKMIKAKDDRRLRHVPILGSALWTFLLGNIIINGNGLEPGLLAACILLSLLVYSVLLEKRRTDTSPHTLLWTLLGILLGLTVLARIDAVFLVFAIICVELFFNKETVVRERIKVVVILAVTSFIISLPWWAYNYTTFGSIMPISGQSESIDDHFILNLFMTPRVLGDLCLVIMYIPEVLLNNLLRPIVGLCIIGSVLFIGKRLQWRTFLRQKYHTETLIVLVIYAIPLIVYYTFFFSASHFIARYYHPIRILSIIIAAMLVPNIIDSYRRSRVIRVVAITYIVVGVIFNVLHYTMNFYTTSSSPAYHVSQWAINHPQYKIGMTSSGTAGFFADNIVNLDGKVNADALKARKQQQLGEYCLENNINLIADTKENAEMIIEQAARKGAQFKLIHSIADMQLHERIR